MKKIVLIVMAIILCLTVFGADIIKETETLEKNILTNKVQVTEERVLDLGVKRKGNDGKVYAGKEDVAYTGKFALFLGDIVEYTETYVDGVLNGAKTWYSDDGKIVLEENYQNNKVEGEQKAYYENGNIKSVVTYKNGRIVGIEALAQDGTVLHKSDLSKGTGVWRYFWENGKVLEEGRYKNWKKDGVWVKYRENGEVDVTTIYKNGKLVSQVWG